LYAGYFLKNRTDLLRVDRTGKPCARQDSNAARPGLLEFSENVGKIVTMSGGVWKTLMGFPADRVIDGLGFGGQGLEAVHALG
jgi:hypothetical protein